MHSEDSVGANELAICFERVTVFVRLEYEAPRLSDSVWSYHPYDSSEFQMNRTEMEKRQK